MKKNKLSGKSAETLKSELRGVKIVTGTLAIMLAVLLMVTLYGLQFIENNKVFIAGTIVTIFLSIIFPLQFNAMRKIKKELKQRATRN